VKRIILIVGAIVLLTGLGLSSAAESPPVVPAVPAKDMVTMVDIGARECIPCKMMAPILESLEKDYSGRAAIVFIDVWKNREEGRRFGIRMIPTQIFYDKSGKEVYRHEGFLDKDSIVAKLEALGVQSPYPVPSPTPESYR
jgi:thioredoxin 1